MPDLKAKSSTGQETKLSQEAVQGFGESLRGELLLPDSPGYDQARRIWNAMIDRRPALIARCAGASDVVQAVRFAREQNLLVSVRGGGHNIAGNAVCEAGMMIDLSAMRSVRIDAANRRAWVEPGCTLADVDHDTQVFGLAAPLGINSTTGVAGLTLGGGFGWLSRKYGLTVDSLLSADVVTAEGELVTASETQYADLFWALRGGSGNFGVVTCFEFELHEVGPQVLSGLIVHPFEDAPAVLRFYRQFVAQIPEELSVWAVLRKAPPLPFLPEPWHGKEVLILPGFYCAEPQEGLRVLEPLRRFGRPIADVIGLHPYVGWQRIFDPLLTPGARNYWKSHNLVELNDGLLDVLVDFAGRLPSGACEVFLGQLGGASSRVADDATAYAHRDAQFVLNVHTRWQDAAQDGQCIAWAREFFDKTTPYATSGIYVNFMPQDDLGRVSEAYGSNYDRLAAIKRKYDPQNLFHMNQNIKPAD